MANKKLLWNTNLSLVIGDMIRMKKLLVILCMLWVGFIFYNSSSSGYISQKSSFAVVNFLRSEKAKIYNANGTENEQSKLAQNKKADVYKFPITKRDNTLNFIVRKNAHGFEYLILAVFISCTLFINNLKGKNALVYIMFVCLSCAVLDEFNQKLVMNRTSSVVDVLIDFSGSLIGTTFFYIVYYCRRKAIKRMP